MAMQQKREVGAAALPSTGECSFNRERENLKHRGAMNNNNTHESNRQNVTVLTGCRLENRLIGDSHQNRTSCA
jgi:hypothetical protein